MVGRYPYILPVGDVPARIANIKVHRMATPGWNIMPMPWGSVYGPFAPRILRDVAYWSDTFHRMLARELLVEIEMPIRVRVRTPEELYKYYHEKCEEYGRKPSASAYAYYVTELKEISVPWKKEYRGHIQKALAHELTHAYLFIGYGLLGLPWFREGVAEYFAFFGMERGRPVPGALEVEVYWDAYNAMKDMRLGYILSLSGDEFYGNPDLNYSIAGAFVAFLAEKEGILSVVQRMLDGRMDDLLEYENDFREYLDSIVNQGPPPGYQYGEIISH